VRFASYIRPLPRLPRLPTPTLTSQDVARALTEVLQNQAVIMNEIAQIKSAMQWLNGQTFGAIAEVADLALHDNGAFVVAKFIDVNTSLAQALSD
jgi:hypothetical protein